LKKRRRKNRKYFFKIMKNTPAFTKNAGVFFFPAPKQRRVFPVYGFPSKD